MFFILVFYYTTAFFSELSSKSSLVMGTILDLFFGSLVMLGTNSSFYRLLISLVKKFGMNATAIGVIIIIGMVFVPLIRISYNNGRRNYLCLYVLDKNKVKLFENINNSQIIGVYCLKYCYANFIDKSLMDKYIKDSKLMDISYDEMLYDIYSYYLIETKTGWFGTSDGKKIDAWKGVDALMTGNIRPSIRLLLLDRQDYDILLSSNSKFCEDYHKKIGRRVCVPISFEVNL